MIILTVQILITILFLTNVFHTNINMPFIVMMGVLMLFALIAIGISLVLVAFSKNSASANAMQNTHHCTNMLTCWMLFPI